MTALELALLLSQLECRMLLVEGVLDHLLVSSSIEVGDRSLDRLSEVLKILAHFIHLYRIAP